MGCDCQTWGQVIETSPDLRVRVNGATGDTVFELSNPDVTFSTGDKVILLKVGSSWVVNGRFS